MTITIMSSATPPDQHPSPPSVSLTAPAITTQRVAQHTLTESAKAVVRTKGTYLSARYHRIKSRRGHARATIATAHKILTAAYHILPRGVPYNELGEEFFYRRDTEQTGPPRVSARNPTVCICRRPL